MNGSWKSIPEHKDLGFYKKKKKKGKRGLFSYLKNNTVRHDFYPAILQKVK